MKKKVFSRKTLLGLMVFVLIFLAGLTSAAFFKTHQLIKKETSKESFEKTPEETEEEEIEPPAPFEYPLSYNLNYFNETLGWEGWRSYDFDIKRKSWDENTGKELELTNIGVFSLMLPPEVSVEEKYIRNPEKTLVISKGGSTLYLGETDIFSTSGSFFCLNCQNIGYIRTNILHQKQRIPIMMGLNRSTNKIEYTTKSFQLVNGCQEGCVYHLSIIASSLDDFLLFLQIMETAEFRWLEKESANKAIEWKTYQDERYDFEFYYPPELTFISNDPSLPLSLERVTFSGPENQQFDLEIYPPPESSLDRDYVSRGDCGSQLVDWGPINLVITTKQRINVLERRQYEERQEGEEARMRIDYCFVSGTGNLVVLRSTGLPSKAEVVNKADDLLYEIISTIQIGVGKN